MPLNSSVRENGEIIVTSGSCLTIETAAEFSRIIREALEASNTVTVEFDQAVEFDITGVQVLCSACKTAARSGKNFSYHGLQPRSMTEVIAASGAERHAACKHNNTTTCSWFGGAN